jgi:hypothetical protein
VRLGADAGHATTRLGAILVAMKTALIILFFLVLYGAVSRLIGVAVLNIAGLPGALIARNATRRTEPRYITGLIVSTIGQAYVYLAFMIYIINWTRTHTDPESFSKYVIWFFCAVATIGAIQRMHIQASKELKENPTDPLNPQIQALFCTEVLSFFGFFVFLFFPGISEPLWTWVNRLGFPY